MIRLQKAKELIKGYHMEHDSGHPMFSGEDLEALDWLIEQAEKAQRFEKALEKIIQETSCDDTWDFANRVLKNQENTNFPYRFSQK